MAKKQFYNQIVRRNFKDKKLGHYYIEKGTGRRVKEETWKAFKNFQKEEQTGTVVDLLSKEFELPPFYGTSMPNVFNQILFKTKSKRLYGIDAAGKKHRISKKNVHKYLLAAKANQNDWYEAEKANRAENGEPKISSNEYYHHLLFQLQLSKFSENVLYVNLEDYDMDDIYEQDDEFN